MVFLLVIELGLFVIDGERVGRDRADFRLLEDKDRDRLLCSEETVRVQDLPLIVGDEGLFTVTEVLGLQVTWFDARLVKAEEIDAVGGGVRAGLGVRGVGRIDADASYARMLVEDFDGHRPTFEFVKVMLVVVPVDMQNIVDETSDSATTLGGVDVDERAFGFSQGRCLAFFL